MKESKKLMLSFTSVFFFFPKQSGRGGKRDILRLFTLDDTKVKVISFTQGKDDVLNLNDVNCREIVGVNNLSIFFWVNIL
jgi:hypothetical protein